jgi:hypothetical protein
MTVTITRKAAALLLVAVAFAVTGTATAAKVKQMFTGANIVNGSLTGLDVKKASLGGALIKKNTLLASHFKAGQLPAGPQGQQGQQGSQGQQGPQGVPGLAGREIVSASTATSGANSKFLLLACPAGKVALGGGGQILYPAGNWVGSEVALSSSLPNGSGWLVRATEAGPVAAPGTWQLEGHVVCAAVPA